MNNDLLPLLNKAYFFLKFRPRTKREIKNYLLKKIKNRHFSTDDVEKVVKELEEENLINDEEFVSWFVEQRKTTRQKSQYVLKKELLRLGVEEELIEKYFLEHPVDEEELAFKALSSKWSRFKDLPEEKRFQKAVNFLLRRGFSFQVSKKIFDKLVKINKGEVEFLIFIILAISEFFSKMHL